MTQPPERYVDLLADMGTEDNTFREVQVQIICFHNAIHYYLDEDAEEVYDNEDGFDWDE